MIAYESMGLINFSSTFPNTAAINATSAGATNGTPLMAAWVNDLWAFEQTLLYWAGITPSGVAEAAPASTSAALGNAQQKLQALQMAFGAPGELVFDCIAPGSGTYGSQSMAWGAATGGPPTRYQYRRVIACIGQVITIANYPDLCAAIYCGDANNATADYCYKSTDSGGVTHSTSGTYMKLPDFRGLTVRGYDHGGVHDPLGATRGVANSGGLLASLQQDAFQGHLHGPLAGFNGFWGQGGSTNALSGTGLSSNQATTGSPLSDTGYAEGDGTTGVAARTSKETRMYNASCNISVRY